MPKRNIGVGVAVIVVHPTEDKILTGRRKKWPMPMACPGGHLEENETFYHCAYREVQEETGLRVAPRFVDDDPDDCVFHALNRYWHGKHTVTLFVVADAIPDQANGLIVQNLEPDKHEDWTWRSLEELDQMQGPHMIDWIPTKIIRRKGILTERQQNLF